MMMIVVEGSWEFINSRSVVSKDLVWEEMQYTVWHSGVWGSRPGDRSRLSRSATTSPLGSTVLHWWSCLHWWHSTQSRYCRKNTTASKCVL